MTRYSNKLAIELLFATILFVGTMSGASDVWAKEKGNTVAKQIQGTWNLVSIYNELDGKKTDVFGPNPRGSMILTPNGRFSFIIIRAEAFRSLLPTTE
jgi:hypothetical protein